MKDLSPIVNSPSFSVIALIEVFVDEVVTTALLEIPLTLIISSCAAVTVNLLSPSTVNSSSPTLNPLAAFVTTTSLEPVAMKVLPSITTLAPVCTVKV